jgi:large subunit ribosomal protein L31e
VVTINLHKRLHGVTFKKKAARAVKEIKKFAAATMSTKTVKVGTILNERIWSKGVRNVPYRIRVKLTRMRNADEEAEEKMYTLAEVQSGQTKGQKTERVEVEDE